MNYSEAREVKGQDGKGIGIWHWTTFNKRIGTYPSHGCTEACQHRTKEEAERHHYEYELANRRSFEATHAERCLECNEWTPQMVQVRFQIRPLCKKHQTNDIIRKHFPFEPGTSEMGSI